MAIQDSDPERRNLVVTSIAFIVYYLGGGYIYNNEVRIQLINIKFENSGVLTITAWAMLFWFALRYWQTHPNKVISEMKANIISLSQHPTLIKYIEKTTGLKYQGEDGFFLSQIEIKPNRWEMNLTIVKNLEFNEDNELIGNSRVGDKLIIFSGIHGYIIKLKLITIAIIKKPGFTSYAVPYVLFFFAVVIPLSKHAIMYLQ